MHGLRATTQLLVALAAASSTICRADDVRGAQNLHQDTASAANAQTCLGGQQPCVPEESRCHSDQAWIATVDKLAVVAGRRHSHDWLKDTQLPWIVYQHDDPTQPNYFVNRANEACAFLQFVHEYYDCLPQAVAFLHGHLRSWHSGNMKQTLDSFQWDKLTGYADLNRRMGIWQRPLKALGPKPEKALAYGGDVYNGSFVRGQIIGGVAYDSWEAYLWHQRSAARQLYDECLGPLGVGAMPDMLSFHCCTQIAVTRQQLHTRSRDFYKAILLYLQDNTIKGNHRFNKVYTLGDAVAVHWPVILGLNKMQLEGDCQVYGTANCTAAI